MTEVERDEQRGGAFEQTRVVQRTSVDGAHAGNHGGELRDGRFGFGTIATNQCIAIDGMIQLGERLRALRMECRNHWYAR